MFNQGYGGTVAQKVGQGNQVLVQIGLLSHSGRRIRDSIGVSIYSTPDGVSVSTGQANWFDDPGLGGSLIGALYWPPLLLFPFARGINSYGLYQDIWQAVDTYCTQVGAMPGTVTTAHAVYCHNCGVVNNEGDSVCRMCGSSLYAPQPTQQVPTYQPPPTPPGEVVCPRCGQTVSTASFVIIAPRH
jgi:RNA polymerase subunit RPABC4/transcription elongation factor Spt4